MSHVHEYTKNIQADDEQLPDSEGNVVTYVGFPKGDFDLKERFAGGAATVAIGQTCTAPDGAQGVVVSQSAAYQYGKKLNGVGPVVEVTTKARVDLTGGAQSF